MSEHNHRPDLRMADCEACVADPTPEPLTAEEAVRFLSRRLTRMVQVPTADLREVLATLDAARDRPGLLPRWAAFDVKVERERIRLLLVGMQDNCEWIEERLDDLIEKLGLDG